MKKSVHQFEATQNAKAVNYNYNGTFRNLQRVIVTSAAQIFCV